MTLNSLNSDQLIDALQWRYATKVFDLAKKIPDATWKALERVLVLSPSSYGLQPYRALLVKDAGKREALLPFSWGQRQVVEASHFLVLAAKTGVSERDVEEFISLIAATRGMPSGSLAGYQQMIVGDLVNGARKAIVGHWAARQAYLALGNVLTGAALLGVDACPMEGFQPGDYDRVLGLEGSGYGAVVACALGYRSAEDKLAGLAKVRFSVDHLLQTV
jgi:nitroreductase